MTDLFEILATNPYPDEYLDMMGGQVDFTFIDFSASIALIEGGKLHAGAGRGLEAAHRRGRHQARVTAVGAQTP